jgi:hypothetical protein
MPQAIEPNKEQHQNPNNHTVVTQLGLSARFPVHMIENLFKPQQIQKLDQPQKTSKGTQPLCAGVIGRRSGDFSGDGRAIAKAFTGAILRDSLRMSFNHLGYLLFHEMSFGKPNHNRESRWFSIFYSPLGARSRLLF